jgi:ABC-2 type transport system ATP-binding protein
MIEVEHLSKIYGSTVAIDDVDFSVKQGEILGFLGPNGAGKTTTMRILAGFIPATTGTARVAGYDVHSQSMQVRQNIGYLPENPPLYPEMTVEGFLDFVARIKGVVAGERGARVNRVIEQCQLTEKRRVLIRKLSKGYKQRVGIAQAIVHDPPVIILDEPTVGLDPQQIIEVRYLIKNLAQQHTVILSTHILPEVSMSCDRATIIHRGKVVARNIPAQPSVSSNAPCHYEISLEGDIDTVLPHLESLPSIEQVKVYAQEQPQRFTLSIHSASPQEISPEIAKIIVHGGLSLLEMRRLRPTLEDIFLQIIGSEALS